MRKGLIWCLLMIGLIPLLFGQLTVVVEQLPDYTPAEDSIYLVGSFNNWQPADENFRFEPLGDGRWQYDFLTPMPDFEYKITRGSWESVEGGSLAEPIGNRSYLNNDELRDTVRIHVAGWEDLKKELPFWDTILVRITSLPENTPTDASLYIVGSFNGWSPADQDFRMERDSNGFYQVAVPIRSQITEYKISRGGWATVESRANGLARPNRRYEHKEGGGENIIRVEIANWEDLSGNRFNWYAIFLLLAAIQGLLLVVAVNSFKEAGSISSRLLSLLLLLLSITFLARIGAFDRDIFQRFPKILLVPDLVYFTYGPIFWLYLRSLQPSLPNQRHWAWHFIPLLLAIGIYLPTISLPNFDFTTQVVNLKLRPFFIGTAMVGWVFSAFYWLLSRNFLKRLQLSSDPAAGPMLGFLWTVFYIHSVCLIVWFSTYLLGFISLALDQNWTDITDRVTDASWLILASGAYMMGYYAMRHPQIFRNPKLPLVSIPQILTENPMAALENQKQVLQISEQQASAASSANTNAPALGDLERLELLMREQKPYLNPGLSLGELAATVDLPSHQLSKVINDGFQKNFFDYVNSYRIEAFKEQIRAGAHQERTILSLALESGFNSKTAFNRAFKKHTNQTPREYLREQENRTS
ncbi:MAG: helix-turn-helix domain-containing protein [Bacteroidota bacterium]